MFQFEDKDIDSSLCGAYDDIHAGDGETEYGFILTVKSTEVLLTDSEVDYIRDQINKLKGE